MTKKARQLLIGLTWCSALLAASGCSAPALSEQDTRQAHQVLTAALQAWKSNAVPQLALRKPPVRFTDEDQVSGLQLVNYVFLDTARPPVFHVELTLRTRQGNISTNRATYQVNLTPQLSVVRGE